MARYGLFVLKVVKHQPTYWSRYGVQFL